jgi:hypothetical protein
MPQIKGIMSQTGAWLDSHFLVTGNATLASANPRCMTETTGKDFYINHQL